MTERFIPVKDHKTLFAAPAGLPIAALFNYRGKSEVPKVIVGAIDIPHATECWCSYEVFSIPRLGIRLEKVSIS